MEDNRCGEQEHTKSGIAERDWLACGLIWVTLGALASCPFGTLAHVGKALFLFVLALHGFQGLYVAFRAWEYRLATIVWFLRTLVLGALAVIAVERVIRKSHGREAKTKQQF